MDFGITSAGGDIVFANDVIENACKTLGNYFPDTDIRHSDISQIQSFPDVDIVVGGYPCQSFSMAGNRKPNNDDRTNLYKHFLRVLETVRPKYFVAENVSGLKHLGAGSFLEQQLTAYKAAGYQVSYHMVNARAYGVPQSRKRLFIIGVRNDLGNTLNFLLKHMAKRQKRILI